MKKTEKFYITEYCNMVLEWERAGHTADTASESELACIQELQAKALEQSGLSLNELTLIMLCRNYRIFRKVNTYARKQIQK